MSVVRHFAEAAGVTNGHAKQLISGNGKLVDRVVKILHACRTARRPEVADRIMRPILEAYFEPHAPDYTPALICEAVKADAAEDVARTEWLLSAQKDPDRFLKTLDREIYEKCALREALMRKLGR